MTQTEIKKIFKQHNVQLGKDTMPQIMHELKWVVIRMAKRCQDGNLKRLTPEFMYIAMGKLLNE